MAVTTVSPSSCTCSLITFIGRACNVVDIGSPDQMELRNHHPIIMKTDRAAGTPCTPSSRRPRCWQPLALQLPVPTQWSTMAEMASSHTSSSSTHIYDTGSTNTQAPAARARSSTLAGAQPEHPERARARSLVDVGIMMGKLLAAELATPQHQQHRACPRNHRSPAACGSTKWMIPAAVTHHTFLLTGSITTAVIPTRSLRCLAFLLRPWIPMEQVAWRDGEDDCGGMGN